MKIADVLKYSIQRSSMLPCQSLAQLELPRTRTKLIKTSVPLPVR